jgi:hypothetical protein
MEIILKDKKHNVFDFEKCLLNLKKELQPFYNKEIKIKYYEPDGLSGDFFGVRAGRIKILSIIPSYFGTFFGKKAIRVTIYDVSDEIKNIIEKNINKFGKKVNATKVSYELETNNKLSMFQTFLEDFKENFLHG